MTLLIKKELFQWEKNRYVYLGSTEQAQRVQSVQFFNSKSKYAREALVENGRVQIPNSLLKEKLPITVLACATEDGENQVITRKTFKVLSRPKPAGYIDEDGSGDIIIDGEIIYDGGEEV